MGKIIILLTFLSLSLAKLNAQSSKTGNFSFGIEGALPVKEETQIFDAGIGGSFEYQHQIIGVLYGGLIGGFESFSTIKKLISVNVPANYNYVPIKAELKCYPVSGLFIMVSAGEVYYTRHGGGHAFDASSGLGWSFKKGFELGFRYEAWKQTPQNHIPDQIGQTGPFKSESTFGQIAIRLAERF